MDNNSKRITYKRARPNPLFQDWLEELHEEAKEKRSKLEPMLKKALESLSKYPLPLQSGAECGILKGFKRQLCNFLDRRLDVHRRNLSLEPNVYGEYQNIRPSLDLIHPSVQWTRSNSGPKRVTSTVTSASLGINLDREENVHGSVPVDLYMGVGTSNSSLNSQRNINNNVYQLPIDEVLRSSGSYNNNQIMPVSNTAYTSSTIPNDRDSETPPLTKNYVPFKPLPRSGAYAILRALLEHSKDKPGKPYLTKEELISKAQRHCDESFINHKDNCIDTAWCSMSNLEIRGLVLRNRYKRTVYSLTDDGLELANELLRESNENVTVNTVASANPEAVPGIHCKQNSGNNIESSEWIPEVIEMPAGSFDVILLIDKNETGSASRRNESTVDIFKRYPDLKHEYKSLKVGDFVWIARHKENKDQELVLPYIVERKRMDDLASSIKDGRFREQKFRLRKCGLKHVIYLVENHGNNTHLGLPLQTLKQAIDNTRVQDEFKIHFTNSLVESAKFLAMMTKRLTIRFQENNLRGTNYDTNGEDLMTFQFFNKTSSKTKALTVTETFIKMLLQLNGLSVEKAIAITNKYSTPSNLIEAYRRCDDRESNTLLANLKYGDKNHNIGPMISNKIYLLFTRTSLI